MGASEHDRVQANDGRGTRGSTCASFLLLVPVFWSLTLGPGCSFAFVNGPPPEPVHRGDRIECTSNAGWPVVDSLLTTWFLLNLMLNASKDAQQFQGGQDTKTGAVALGIGLSALTLSSAVVGFSRVSNCNDALARSEGTWSPRPRLNPRPVSPPLTPSSFPPPAASGTSGAGPSPVTPGAPPPPGAPPAPGAPANSGVSPAASGGTGGAAPPVPTPSGPPPVHQIIDSE